MSPQKRITVILILLSFCAYYSNAFAQTDEKWIKEYTLESLDGTPQKVYLLHEIGADSYIIKCSNDSIRIDDTYGISGEPVILNKNFLRIVYNPRLGSNQSCERVLFLCISNKKLYIAMHVTLNYYYELTEVYNKKADSLKLFNEKSVYELKLKLTGGNKNDYKLTANIHDMNSSKHDPSTNYNYDDKTVLNFDAHENIFYNDFIELNTMFNVYDPDPAIGEHKQRITGNFPIIKLGKMEYYYINDRWYEGSKDDNGKNILFGYSTSNAH